MSRTTESRIMYDAEGQGQKRKRKRRHGHPSGESKTIVVQMDTYNDGDGFAPIVRVVDGDNPHGYLMGLPIETFGFDISKGKKFKITCEPLD